MVAGRARRQEHDMAIDSCPGSAHAPESALAGCVEQLEGQRRALTTSRFPLPSQLVITCVEPAVDPIVTRLAPCFRVRKAGLALDAELRDAMALALSELGVRSVVVVGHTRCDHVAASAVPARAARHLGGSAQAGAYGWMSAAAARAGRRFADARLDLRGRLLTLRDDACLVGPDGRRATCFGVLYVAESGTTHVYAPDADCFALVG